MSIPRSVLVRVGITTLALAQAHSVAATGTILQQAAVQTTGAAQTAPESLKPEASKKGVGHMFCIYMIFATLKETIDVCYPGQYVELRGSIEKWLPQMYKYAKENGRTDKDRSFPDDLNLEMKKYGKRLDDSLCRASKSYLERLSHDAKLDTEIESTLAQSDEPGQKYGCL